MKKVLLGVIAIVLVLALCCCNAGTKKAKDTSETGSGSSVVSSEPTESSDSNSQEDNGLVALSKVDVTPTYNINISSFDTKFMSYISQHTKGNYMVSPLSYKYALGLVLAGTNGNTKTELINALGISDENEWYTNSQMFNGFTSNFNEKVKRLSDQSEEKVEYDLKVANSVWRNESYTAEFTDSFKNIVSRYFGAEYQSFNQGNVTSRVNKWVSQKTNNMINKLLPDDYDVSGTVTILMNSLYFKDGWVEQFNEANTKDGDFTKADGSVTTKSFMNNKKECTYYEDDSTQILTLDMYGDVKMSFVLGDRYNLNEKLDKSTNEYVDYTIPKIDIETTFGDGQLVDFLKENGAVSMFDANRADFSRMINSNSIYVDDIVQKTKLKLYETGVEASAVTFAVLKESAIGLENKPKVFIANKPFSFYIYTTYNDVTTILFNGEIVE